MELRQLRHFLAVVDQRHFGRAAEAVGITQQALSHSIAVLEKELQTRLFERGRFGAELTAAGRVFGKRARLICGEVDFAASEVMALHGGEEGQITVGVSQNLAATVLPAAVLAFAKVRPKVRLSIQVGTSKQIFDRALLGQIELAVTSPISGVDAYGELQHVEITTGYIHDPGYIILRPGHPLLTGQSVPLSHIGNFPWCMPESWVAPWEGIFALMRASGAQAPGYVVRSDSLDFVKALLAKSDFVSLLGSDSVKTELQARLLCAIAIPLPHKVIKTYLSYRTGHQLQAATNALIASFKSALDQAPPIDPELVSAQCVIDK